MDCRRGSTEVRRGDAFGGESNGVAAGARDHPNALFVRVGLQDSGLDDVGDRLGVGAQLRVMNFTDPKVVVYRDGRGERVGCWARANGVSTRTVRKTARRDTSLIRRAPSDWFLNARSKRRSLSQPLSRDGAEEETGSSAERACREARDGCRRTARSGEKIFVRMHFVVAGGSESCILRMRARCTMAPRARIV